MIACVGIVARHKLMSNGTFIATIMSGIFMGATAVCAATSAPIYLLVVFSSLGLVSAPVTLALGQVTQTLEKSRCHIVSGVTIWSGLYKILGAATLAISIAAIFTVCMGWRPSNLTLSNVTPRGSSCCAICLEDVVDIKNENALILVCGHVFHRQCIRQWVAVKATCPVCLGEIPAPVCRELGEPVRYGIRGNALLRRVSPN